MMSTKENSPVTTEPLYLVVDMRHDLLAGDDTFRLLLDIADEVEPAQEVEGIFVDGDNAYDLIDAYLDAWENAWLATAAAMGHEAIAAGGASPEAHDHVGRNTPEALDRGYTGVSVYDEAWQQVWDKCPTVTLAEVAQ